MEEIEPHCDICGRSQYNSPNILPKMREFEADWNGDTGNHAWCENRNTRPLVEVISIGGIDCE